MSFPDRARCFGAQPGTARTSTLHTHRLSLEPFGDWHLGPLLEIFRDSDVRRYLLDDELVDSRWLVDEIAASAERFASGSLGLWVVQRRLSLEVIGFAGFRPFFDPPDLQLLYGLCPSAWGYGYATEAARAACRFAVERRGLTEIRAATDVPNTASIQVLERLGFARSKTTDDGPAGTHFFIARHLTW